MIAYYFPPFSLSSGYLRPLKFAEYLPEHGWRAEILTVKPSVYPSGARSARSRHPTRFASTVRTPSTPSAFCLSAAGIRGPWPRPIGGGRGGSLPCGGGST